MLPYVVAGVVACSAAAVAAQGIGMVLVGAAASFGAGIGLVLIGDWKGKRSAPDGNFLVHS